MIDSYDHLDDVDHFSMANDMLSHVDQSYQHIVSIQLYLMPTVVARSIMMTNFLHHQLNTISIVNQNDEREEKVDQ